MIVLIKIHFHVQLKKKWNEINIEENYPESSSTNPKCLELAVEVDQHTRNTFSSNTTTTNWAHAILAGVSQVYASEVNLNISIVTTIIWETTDPYASYVNDASNMLDALKNHWTANNSSISRDLVHLLTKRSNTGTGGIAYLMFYVIIHGDMDLVQGLIIQQTLIFQTLHILGI